ncbi:hypothetical protein AN964_04080 [Heyndrickxia shackletonii]|uniref:Uncharacterized protein n=1 Tax=Heyndrickxia shackletonii TaxID=157838 RepID=A0A0Q3TGK5_9BACI|nr:hypothetical protein AN964_04080 [Heyndrickxia shackletonii]
MIDVKDSAKNGGSFFNPHDGQRRNPQWKRVGGSCIFFKKNRLYASRLDKYKKLLISLGDSPNISLFLVIFIYFIKLYFPC